VSREIQVESAGLPAARRPTGDPRPLRPGTPRSSSAITSIASVRTGIGGWSNAVKTMSEPTPIRASLPSAPSLTGALAWRDTRGVVSGPAAALPDRT
jgi:hypothetical protein